MTRLLDSPRMIRASRKSSKRRTGLGGRLCRESLTFFYTSILLSFYPPIPRTSRSIATALHPYIHPFHLSGSVLLVSPRVTYTTMVSSSIPPSHYLILFYSAAYVRFELGAATAESSPPRQHGSVSTCPRCLEYVYTLAQDIRFRIGVVRLRTETTHRTFSWPRVVVFT